MTLVLICWVVALAPAQAQETSYDPVNIAFGTLRPFVTAGPDNDNQGVMVDLAEALAQEIGFELLPFQVPNVHEWAQAQITGRSVMAPLIAKLPVLTPTNVYSDVVTETNVRLAVRTETATDFGTGDLTGRRIGVIPPIIGSDPALNPGAEIVEYLDTRSALVGLLAGEVDAISTETLYVFHEAHSAQLDHRITFVGPSLATVQRFVVIHESRAELLGPVNAALARMRADGRLDEILQRHSFIMPEPVPEMLTVGVANFPPYNIVNDDGTFSGFAVDALCELATLSGLRFRFQEITDAEFGAGPSAGTYDMLPQTAVTAAPREVMDFTHQIVRFDLAIFTRSGEARGLSDLDSLGARKVGVETVNVARRIAERHGGLDLQVYRGRDRLLQALSDGEVDAILYPVIPMNREINQLDLGRQIQEISPPFRIIERAPALRFGLGEVREKLNAALSIFLISDKYADLRQKYFGAPVFWTQNRIDAAAGTGAVLVIALLGFLFWQRQQQRQRQLVYAHQQRELERELVHTESLGKVITELERSNRELDEFAYTASHDLKEPLRGITINANFLAREQLSEKGEGRVERMVALAARMEQLITDLLFFSRLGRGEKVMKHVDTPHIIEGIESELEEWMAERHCEIQFDTALPWVHAERSKVKTVFQNLIVNGLKFNDSAPKTVEVGFDRVAEVNGNMLHDVFWVRDNGIGISDQNRNKEFRIFQRLNREEDYGPGTGAGLSFVRKIIEEYGGAIDLVSQPGFGTTFYFSLPPAKAGHTTTDNKKGTAVNGHISDNSDRRRQPG